MVFMTKKIRSGVFETNSSSVHSLVFSKEGLEPSVLPVDKNDKIITDFGEFGREYCIYNTQAEKLSYLITSLYYLSSGFDSVEGVYDNYDFQTLEKYVCEYTGAAGIKILGETDPYIDHQSIPEYDIDIVNMYDKDSVINFIFNKNIALKTDSD